MTRAKKTDTPAGVSAPAPHEMWLYKGEEARLFAEGEAIPAGWQDKPEGAD